MFFCTEFIYIEMLVFFLLFGIEMEMLKCYLGHLFLILAGFLVATLATSFCVIVYGSSNLSLNKYIE